MACRGGDGGSLAPASYVVKCVSFSLSFSHRVSLSLVSVSTLHSSKVTNLLSLAAVVAVE